MLGTPAPGGSASPETCRVAGDGRTRHPADISFWGVTFADNRIDTAR